MPLNIYFKIKEKFCFPSLKARIIAKNTKISEGFTKMFLECPRTEMERTQRVSDVIIGVFEDDRRPHWLSKFETKEKFYKPRFLHANNKEQ